MNKQEWKVQYAAARLLINARWNRSDPFSSLRPNNDQRDLVWDITYKYIRNNMHYSIGEALFDSNDRYIVNIQKKEYLDWAMKNNSKAFNRKLCKRG